MEPTKRLTRSSTNKMVGGVCGGLAEYFNVDVSLVRLLALLLVLLPGPGVLVYVVCWWIIPEDNAYVEKPKNDTVL
jgi:phage shock protein PspC (stress-responsive transcriptional regulator)